MSSEAGSQWKNRSETEVWILAALEERPLPVENLLAVLKHFGASGLDRRVESWAELVQEALVATGDNRNFLKVLALRCEWHENRASFMPVCREQVEGAFTSRMGKSLVSNSGFDGRVTPAEAVRRLMVLAGLEKGTLCYEKTWGFGTVRRLDEFYARVTVDFERRRGHEMTFAYAAEVLELLPPTHLLVRLHREGDVFRRLVVDDPGEIVRIALQSYGPLKVDDLKEKLTAASIGENQWKGFWDAARKALKSDPLVHMPLKRSDPLRLLTSAESHAVAEYAALAALRDPEEILRKAEMMEAGGLLDAGNEQLCMQVANRLAFAVWGAEDRTPVLAARLLLTAVRLGLVGPDGLLGDRAIDVQAGFGRILEGSALHAVLTGLPARMTGLFIDSLISGFPERAVARLVGLLPLLPAAVVQEVMVRMQRVGGGDALCRRVQEVLAVRKAGPAMLFWLLRGGPDDVAMRTDTDAAELLWQGLDALEWPASGDMLKAQHQLRGLYESAAWLTGRLQGLSGEQREGFLAKVMTCRGWDEIGRRAVVANVIKAHPELQPVVSRDAVPRVKAKTRMTSWRSYRERQEQFRKLVEEEIPANAKEIAVARSYGDLRENSEYKYAKEHQRILYRRRDEMEADLEQVKGSDFKGFPSEVAGMGTTVRLRRPDGGEQRFCILGEWDRDAALGIISSLSRLAQCLEGHRAGDAVELPGSSGGMEHCAIIAVEGICPEMQVWLDGQGTDPV